MGDSRRTIGVVTASRADYAICRSVLRQVQRSDDLALHLIVAGTHLSQRYGKTIKEIVGDGFEVGDRVEFPTADDSPRGIAEAMGAATIAFANSYERFRPDLILVLADRYEMHAAAVAALPTGIPVAHIEGGDLTEGAIDDALRHSITKLSHLHFVSTQEYAERVIQLGEEPWRVTVSGAPSLDNLTSRRRLSRQQLESTFGVRLDPGTLLVTFHPVTLDSANTADHIAQLLRAIELLGRPVVFTGSNADTGGSLIRNAVERYTEEHANAWVIPNFGTDHYLSLLEHVQVMVGNSSSGLIEAPSFRLPVVNVGSRQRGRVRASNVIDVGQSAEEIVEGVLRASTDGFRDSLANLVNPYAGPGPWASEVIVARLRSQSLTDPRLLRKRFYDILDRRQFTPRPEDGSPTEI